MPARAEASAIGAGLVFGLVGWKVQQLIDEQVAQTVEADLTGLAEQYAEGGITQLVEEINARRPKDATPNTSRGLFYRADAPRLPLGASISLDGAGEPLAVVGHVRDLDGRPVAGASVETRTR